MSDSASARVSSWTTLDAAKSLYIRVSNGIEQELAEINSHSGAAPPLVSTTCTAYTVRAITARCCHRSCCRVFSDQLTGGIMLRETVMGSTTLLAWS
jgi:hypothetical protein